MAQFDVFVNPVAAARSAYPFVVAVQSSIAQDSRDHIVAPLVPLGLMPKVISRLTPIVQWDGAEHLVLVPALTGVLSHELVERRGSIASERSVVLGAIDYLFFAI